MTEDILIFRKWLNTAKPGSKFVYHEGFLWADRNHVIRMPVGPGLFKPVTVNNVSVSTLANIAWEAYLRGKVELVQRKDGDGMYQYIAVRRKHERPVSRPLRLR